MRDERYLHTYPVCLRALVVETRPDLVLWGILVGAIPLGNIHYLAGLTAEDRADFFMFIGVSSVTHHFT